jgi:benzoyl-CoA 2,3-dioxygenase component B
MRDHGVVDPEQARAFGLIDLETIQKFVNFHYSATLDLFGSEVSSNAAGYYTTGLKGRFGESRIADDHKLSDAGYAVHEVEGNRIVPRTVPALTALNARLRDDYIREIQAGLDRWNRIPDKLGIPFRFALPHVGFNRRIGNFAGRFISTLGEVLPEAEWNSRRDSWLPSESDHQYVESLMGRVVEPGKFANWIAPPVRGINNQPIEFEYVRFN